MAGVFRTVYDASQQGPAWWFPAFGLIFVAVGVGLVIAAHPIGRMTGWQKRPRGLRGFSYFFLGFSLLWTVAASVGVFGSWYAAHTALSSNSASVVEGTVESFHPMPYTGHEDEHFTVDGVYFAYSDYAVTAGFNTTSSHGGPVHAGLYVRIHYIVQNGDNTILKLEIRT